MVTQNSEMLEGSIEVSGARYCREACVAFNRAMKCVLRLSDFTVFHQFFYAMAPCKNFGMLLMICLQLQLYIVWQRNISLAEKIAMTALTDSKSDYITGRFMHSCHACCHDAVNDTLLSLP